jgi:glycerate dehydrogenase
MNREVIEQLPKVKYIGVLATGYNVVDIRAAAENGITVTNIPVYGTESVAQMVFAHLLNLTQHVAAHAESVAHGKWSSCPDFCFWDFPLIELHGLTMGIIGCGRIGRSTARLAAAFGMKVIGHDNYAGETSEIELLEIDEVFRRADVISLHCPLTGETEKLVNEKRLALMKSSAFLINTSRGPLVDEDALADALNNGVIAGAGLDVVSVEPVKPGNPLMNARNCYITPHIAWATFSARQRLLNTAIENVEAFMQGKPQNEVKPAS